MLVRISATLPLSWDTRRVSDLQSPLLPSRPTVAGAGQGEAGRVVCNSVGEKHVRGSKNQDNKEPGS